MLKSSSLCLYSSNFGTFWLKIEQFWPFEEISIFSYKYWEKSLFEYFSRLFTPEVQYLCKNVLILFDDFYTKIKICLISISVHNMPLR
jgi:hypothetical protein